VAAVIYADCYLPLAVAVQVGAVASANETTPSLSVLPGF
jgi:hypothetical protein